VVCRLLAHAANEDLGCLFLFVAGDGALGIDLSGPRSACVRITTSQGFRDSQSCRRGSAP
jgi:hypothetical protein